MGLDKDTLRSIASSFEKSPQPEPQRQEVVEPALPPQSQQPIHINVSVPPQGAEASPQRSVSDDDSYIQGLERVQSEIATVRTETSDANRALLERIESRFTEEAERRQEELRRQRRRPRPRGRTVERSSNTRWVVAGVLALSAAVVVVQWDDIEQWSECRNSGAEDCGFGDSEVATQVPEQNQSAPFPDFPGDGSPIDPNENRRADDTSSAPITAPPAPYEAPVETMPEYDPCYVAFANDEEMAPGVEPERNCFSGTGIVRLSNGQVVESNVASGEALASTGSGYLLQEEGDGTNFYVIDDTKLVHWAINPEQSVGGAYTIGMRQSAVDGGFLSDQTFGEYLNSGDLTDNELFTFLTHNKVVPNYLDQLYIKIVGSESQTLREIVIRGVSN